MTDGAPALALGLEQGDPDIMDQKPRKPDEPVINKSMLIGISIQAVAITAVVLSAFLIGLNYYPDNLRYAETMAFVTLSFSELLRAYTSRSERYSIFKIGVFTNRFMQYAVISSIIILILIIYLPFLNTIFETVPLLWQTWLLLLPLILVPSIAAELTKLIQVKFARA